MNTSSLPLLTAKEQQRFWRKINKLSPSECWPWTGATNTRGYGKFRVNKKLYYATRMVWFLAHGAQPDGLGLLHKCDNPICCNPDHLFLGSRADNVADMTSKRRNRVPLGSDHSNATLTDSDVIAIRRLRATTSLTGVEIGKQFGVTKSTVARIITRQIWKHL